MSDTAIAILILPVLIALTVVLECTRVGCTKLSRHLRAGQNLQNTPAKASTEL